MWCVLDSIYASGVFFKRGNGREGRELYSPLPPIHSHATFSDWSCGRVVVVVGVSCLFIHAKGFISQADLGADNFVQKTDLRTECKYANLPWFANGAGVYLHFSRERVWRRPRLNQLKIDPKTVWMHLVRCVKSFASVGWVKFCNFGEKF